MIYIDPNESKESFEQFVKRANCETNSKMKFIGPIPRHSGSMFAIQSDSLRELTIINTGYDVPMRPNGIIIEAPGLKKLKTRLVNVHLLSCDKCKVEIYDGVYRRFTPAEREVIFKTFGPKIHPDDYCVM